MSFLGNVMMSSEDIALGVVMPEGVEIEEEEELVDSSSTEGQAPHPLPVKLFILLNMSFN